MNQPNFSCNPQQTKVALIAGGTSDEREISLASGAGAYDALREAGFQVEQIDPAEKNDLVKLVTQPFDVAFLVLHGKRGEDGTIQGMLELLDIPYTGSGIWSSATAIDKIKAKQCYKDAQIATPSSFSITSNDTITAGQIVKMLGSNCVIKAATEGSALGVYVCHSADEITQALQSVFTLDDKALAEQFIAGDEFTVAVLGNEQPEALPVIQIIPKHDFYDFESKYETGGSQHVCPAQIDKTATLEAQRLAVAAHRALECRGVSRTDLIRDAQGTFWVLETNTLPGMTATSLLPDAARAAGISFPELCTMLINFALEG